MAKQPRIYNHDNKVMKLGWNWFTEDQYDLHMNTKRAIYQQMNSGEINWSMLAELMKVKKEWLNVRPNEKKPPNYQIIQSVCDKYRVRMSSLAPSITNPIAYGKYQLMKPAILKILILFQVLYKEDIAYTDRIGGSIQYMYRHPDNFIVADKLRGIEELFEWWKSEDWREVTKPVITFIFENVIKYYKNDEFIRNSINLIIDELFKQQSKFIMIEALDPPHWYPRGVGQVNYVVHNRERHHGGR